MSVIESPRNEIELEVGSRKAEEDSALSRRAPHHGKRTLSLPSGTDKTQSLVLLSRLMVNRSRGYVNSPAKRFIGGFLFEECQTVKRKKTLRCFTFVHADLLGQR